MTATDQCQSNVESLQHQFHQLANNTTDETGFENEIEQLRVDVVKYNTVSDSFDRSQEKRIDGVLEGLGSLNIKIESCLDQTASNKELVSELSWGLTTLTSWLW